MWMKSPGAFDSNRFEVGARGHLFLPKPGDFDKTRSLVFRVFMYVATRTEPIFEDPYEPTIFAQQKNKR